MEAITTEKLTELKAKYGKLLKVTLNGDEYIVKPLKRSEYSAILESMGANIKPTVHDEEVVRKGVVYPTITPEFFSNSLAGHIPTLAARILESSGFTDQVKIEEV